MLQLTCYSNLSNAINTCESICADYRDATGAAGVARSTLTELHRQISYLQAQRDNDITLEDNMQGNS